MIQMYKEDKEISIFIDKENRKEYITCNRFMKKYKTTHNNVDMYYTKQEIKNLHRECQYLATNENLYYQMQERKFTIDTLGTLLTDFLNIDFGDKEQFFKFIDKYSIYILRDICELNMELKDLYSNVQYEKLMQDIFSKYNLDISNVKNDFVRVIDYVYNLYNLKEIEEYTPYERYYTLNTSRMNNTVEKYSKKLKLDFETDINRLVIEPAGQKEKYIYEQITAIKNKGKNKLDMIRNAYLIFSTDISSIMYITLLEIISMKDFAIKKCQNCGKYFVPQKRTDEIYCNNIFEDKMTCKQIGSKLFKKKKLQDENSIDRLYRNAYQQKFLRMQRNPNNQEYKFDFEWFKERVKEIRQEIKDNKKTEEDLKKWLLDTKDKRRFER